MRLPRLWLLSALLVVIVPPWPPDWTLVGLVAVLLTLDLLTTTPKGLPVGYRNPLVTIDLAEALGADITDANGHKIGREPAEEFEGLWVVIRNPKLQPQGVLVPPETKLGPDGTPSVEDAMGGMRVVVSRLVYDWNLPDPADPAGEDAEPLPIHNKDDHRTRGPAVEDVEKIPGAVVLMIGERIRQAVAPR